MTDKSNEDEIRRTFISAVIDYSVRWTEKCICHENENETEDDACPSCDAYIALEEAIKQAEALRTIRDGREIEVEGIE